MPRHSIDVARQHFALADMVGGADNAFRLHALDDAGGAVVADLQVALDEAGRRLALAAHQRHRLVVELVARAAALAVAGEEIAALLLVVLGDLVDIDRRAAVLLEEADDTLDFLIRDEGAVDAGDAAAALHIEHVAAAQELLGAGLAEDGAAVDLRRHLEADAGREIRLDRAGDDVDRGALRRHHDMDAG